MNIMADNTLDTEAIRDSILEEEFKPVLKRLSKEHKQLASALSAKEAKLLVQGYYTAQEERIRAAARVRRALAQEEPSDVLKFFTAQAATIEEYAKAALDVYTYNNPIGHWMREQKGIGPVLAAGHLAFIDIKKAPYAGHIWSYAGLTPQGQFRRGEKAHFNPQYKKICWLTGESFIKVSGRDCFYGNIFKGYRKYEDDKNDCGAYAEKAAMQLRERNYGDDTVAKSELLKGRLPKAQLLARARRRTVKVFLSHVHHMLYVREYGKVPPAPYAITHLGHLDYIAPPPM